MEDTIYLTSKKVASRSDRLATLYNFNLQNCKESFIFHWVGLAPYKTFYKV